MNTILKIISESISQALQQLRGNKLRSFLSLLGISIGIFCIIGVLSAVDSLENNVRSSIEKLGDDVVYVSKFSWGEDPGSNYYKIMRRPNINYGDFEAIQDRVNTAGTVSYHVGIGDRIAKYRSNSVDGTFFVGVTYEFGEMFNLQYLRGRYFSPAEYHFGANKVILGYNVADELFGPLDPLGKSIKVSGRKLEVIGVLEKTGESLVNVMNFDDGMILSFELARKIANLKADHPFGNSMVNVKAAQGVPTRELKDELTGVLRAHRKLRPKEEANFALNELSVLSNLLNNFFGVLNMVGASIGIFAIFVGIFSVANIMFVSVKERTNIIGVKKALGAKRYIILLEFLIEAIILCVFGGLVGLLLVYLIVTFLSGAIDFQLFLSFNNILLGIGISIAVGLLAGLIPAMQASRLDPVVAMRQ